MANSDKNIVITPNNGSANANPNIVFSGSFDPSQPATDPITLTVLPTTPGAINFSGSTGNLLLIRNNLDNTVYTQGNVTASYFIGNGSQLTGIGSASTANTAQTVTNNAQPNITSVGTLTSLSVSGNANIGNIGTGIITATGNITGASIVTGISGGVFTNTISASGNANVGNLGAINGVFTNISGNGAALTAITGANITGTVPNAAYATTADTVTNNAQPNITSVGILTSLSVSGNITAGNINGGNLTQANYIVGTSEVRIGNVPGENWSRIQHLNTSNSYGFNSPLNQMLVITNEEATVKQALVLADATTSYSSPMFGVSVYEGNNSGPSTGNETWVPIFTVTGTGDISTAGTITSGGLSVTGNSNVGNIGTTGFITATGNIQGGNLITSGMLSVGGNANIGNIATGIISATGNVTAPFFIGNGSQLTGIAATTSQTVTNNAQPNITSVGTLTNLSVSGNTSTTNLNVTTSITKNNRNVPSYVAQSTAPTDPLLGDQWYDIDTGVLYQYQSDGTSSYWQDMSTNVGTLSSLSVTGNTTVGNLNISGNIVDSGPLSIQTSSNGNITLSPNGSGIVNSTGPIAISNDYLTARPSFRNKVINGAMTIDQRSNGANVSISSTSNTFVIDRFWAQASGTNSFTVSLSSVAPDGFKSSLITTVNTANTSPAAGFYASTVRQNIEGLNSYDFMFGTPLAKTITASFWVRCSVTGTYPFFVSNKANNRSRVFSYVVNAANTWEFKTITIPGDTAGTWETDTSTGLKFGFDLGSGSNYHAPLIDTWYNAEYTTTASLSRLIANSGATLYITGLQLEIGSVATPFEYRSYGIELNLCQRYFQSTIPTVYPNFTYRYSTSDNWGGGLSMVPFKETMRAAPTVTIYPGDTRVNSGNVYVNNTTNSTGYLLGAYQDGFQIWNGNALATVGEYFLFHYDANIELSQST